MWSVLKSALKILVVKKLPLFSLIRNYLSMEIRLHFAVQCMHVVHPMCYVLLVRRIDRCEVSQCLLSIQTTKTAD